MRLLRRSAGEVASNGSYSCPYIRFTAKSTCRHEKKCTSWIQYQIDKGLPRTVGRFAFSMNTAPGQAVRSPVVLSSARARHLKLQDGYASPADWPRNVSRCCAVDCQSAGGKRCGGQLSSPTRQISGATTQVNTLFGPTKTRFETQQLDRVSMARGDLACLTGLGLKMRDRRS